MGFFVHIEGLFQCVRCRKVTREAIQTKLLRTELANDGAVYRVGDSEVMDGLFDYFPLYPWSPSSPLVVALGDWACDHCGLPWQWARVAFDVEGRAGDPIVRIREVSGLQPISPDDLAGFHYLEEDLGMLFNFWTGEPQLNYLEGLARWNGLAVRERCELVARGFRAWCREVAGVEPGRPPEAARPES